MLGAFTMNDIAGPKNPPGHFERPLDCEEALEETLSAAIDDIVEAAVAAGWNADEAEDTVISLTHNRRLSQIMDDATDDSIDGEWDASSERTEH